MNNNFKRTQETFTEGEIDIKISGYLNTSITPVTDFTDLKLNDQLLENIEYNKYYEPTIVQKYSIPIVLNGRDLMSCAQTGSGKTAAFLLPIIDQLMHAERPVNHRYLGKFKQIQPFALILAPTRELALQIFDEACKFSARCHLRPCVIYGGENIQIQIDDINRNCDILVATPGRLKDLHDREKINFRNIKYLVLDEADRMLDMGFEPQIRELVKSRDMPITRNRQTLMFSATFPKKIQGLASEFLHDYIFLSVGRVGSASTSISQKLEWVNEKDKPMFLIDVLNADPGTLKLIFVETKRRADQLESYLRQWNFKAASIHGDKNQRERENALWTFKKGQVPILVATSVVARGLDVNNVSCVVNYDLPSDLDDYVHRIGRTGRAGNYGEAISFFNEKNSNIGTGLYELFTETNQEIPHFLAKYKNSLSKFNRSGYTNSQLEDNKTRNDQRRKIENKVLKVSENETRNLKPAVEEVDWFDQM